MPRKCQTLEDGKRKAVGVAALTVTTTAKNRVLTSLRYVAEDYVTSTKVFAEASTSKTTTVP